MRQRMEEIVSVQSILAEGKHTAFVLFTMAVLFLVSGAIPAAQLVGYSFPSPDATATIPDTVGDGITPSNFDCIGGTTACNTSNGV